MIKIEDILNGDFSKYPEDAQVYLKEFNERLREYIKAELTDEMANRMLKNVDKSNETFMSILTEILDNGCKGFNKMSTRSLINLYLEKKNEEAFITLLERVSDEVNRG